MAYGLILPIFKKKEKEKQICHLWWLEASGIAEVIE